MIKFKIKGGQFIFSILLLAHMSGRVCLVEGRICLSENLVLVSGQVLSARLQHLNRVKKKKGCLWILPYLFHIEKVKEFLMKSKNLMKSREKSLFH